MASTSLEERIDLPGATRSSTVLAWGWFWVLLVGVVGFRLWYAGMRQLVPDEAFYWGWTRHLSPGYFDHPPMIAYLMYLSTRVLGNTELGVRLFAVLMPFGAMLLLLWASRGIIAPEEDGGRASWWAAAIYLSSPLVASLATLFTPDTPAIFFSTCALVCALSIVRREGVAPSEPRIVGLWMLFGVCCGLALLSKYTAILLPGSVFLALLFSREGRRHLYRPWIYLSGVVAAGVFSPVVYWNWMHDWISFRFQLGHGMGGTEAAVPFWTRLGERMTTLGEFVGGQTLVWTPVLFGVGVIVIVHFWRRYRRISLPMRVLLWSATLPLVFFGYAASKARGEVNWPDFAYWPLALLTVAWLAEDWAAPRVWWVRTGCIVALVGLVAIHVPEVLGRVGVPKTEEMFAWREMSRQVYELAGGDPVMATGHRDTGELAFYMKGQPDVWRATVTGTRLTSFDFYADRPDLTSMPRVWVLVTPKAVGDGPDLCRRFGFVETRKEPLKVDAPRKALARVLILLEHPSAGGASTKATTMEGAR